MEKNSLSCNRVSAWLVVHQIAELQLTQRSKKGSLLKPGTGRDGYMEGPYKTQTSPKRERLCLEAPVIIGECSL